MPLSPNQPLDEFKIIRRLGAGGFGAVYQAQDTLLNRPVAIKELYAPRAADNDAFQRFLQEARTAGSLNHPNIVTVYGLRVKGDTHYLILEYAPGGSLRERLKREGKLEVSQAVQITAEVAEALAAVHARGIVHRDIKPENILLTEDGHAKVTDFGIAHVPREAGGVSLTQTGFQPGTILYMSPEQMRGEELTGASDVYQLAAVLHEMMTGRHYFDPDALLRQAMQEMKATNPQAPAVQARWMMLVGQAIGERTEVKSSEYPALAQLLEETLSAPASSRATMQVIAQRLRSVEFANQQTYSGDFSIAASAERPATSLPSAPQTSGEIYPVQNAINRFVDYFLLGNEKTRTDSTRANAFRANHDIDQYNLDANRAIIDLSQALRINPRSIESWLARGKLKYRQAEIKLARNNLVLSVNGGSDEIAAASLFGGAISDFTRVLELDARIGEAWRWRGFAHLEKGKILENREIFAESDGAFGKAIADFTHALAINSADAEALSGRGEVHLWQDNSSEAYADFTRALALNPDDAYTRENRGDALRYQGNEEAAALDYIHAYMHAVRINPNSFERVSLATQVSLILSNNPENQLALDVDFPVPAGIIIFFDQNHSVFLSGSRGL